MMPSKYSQFGKTVSKRKKINNHGIHEYPKKIMFRLALNLLLIEMLTSRNVILRANIRFPQLGLVLLMQELLSYLRVKRSDKNSLMSISSNIL